MYLVAGLGNPGREYENTRHNLGFIAIDRLAGSVSAAFKRNRNLAADSVDTRIAGKRVILCKPMTFMNKSGDVLAPLAAYFRIPADKVIVIHDDLDLDFGRVKLAFNRGAGGHNGIRSIINHLGTGFVRVRVGVGRPPGQMEPAAFVLGRMSRDELKAIPGCLDDVCRAVEMIIDSGLAQAMNHFNQRSR